MDTLLLLAGDRAPIALVLPARMWLAFSGRQHYTGFGYYVLSIYFSFVATHHSFNGTFITLSSSLIIDFTALAS
jgi:hypothetical protein